MISRAFVAGGVLLALAACDPFAVPADERPNLVTAETRCTQLSGTPAVRPAKDGTPWKVCTFRDTRVCDLQKLRIDNRCYTDVPDTTPGKPSGS